MTIGYILFAIVSGLCMAVQSPVNATLSRYAGHFQATTISFGTGALVFGILVAILGTGDLSNIVHAQWWQLIGGTYGIYIVLIVTYGIPKLGAALTSTLLTLGNLTTAAILDTFGLMGMTKVALEPARIAGILIVLTGVILVYIGKRKQENSRKSGEGSGKVIFLLLLGGIGGAIQAPTNNALAGHVGIIEASFVSFTVGFLVILVISLVVTKGNLLRDRKDGIRGWMLTGGIFGGAVVFINLTAIAALGSTVLQICTMLGQLSGGMAIDCFGLLGTSKIKANGWRCAGMVIIAIGVTIVALTKR